VRLPPRPALRLFFDTDALLAGAASTQGAAHVLLRLAELGLIEVVTTEYVRAEALRNMERKLPRARPLLAALTDHVVTVLPDAGPASDPVPADVHPKDLPVWLAVRQSGARTLVTFNLRDYPSRPDVSAPGAILAEIRDGLARLRAEAEDTDRGGGDS
jgi:hypothetical protein